VKIILASSNKGKIQEIQQMLPQYKVEVYSDILGAFEIIEDGKSFKENAIIKAKAVDKKLQEINYEDYIVLSDDSGITVPALNNEPGIYSARYAKEGASDFDNVQKLITRLQENKLQKANAYYTACIAIAYHGNIYTTHGWMYGDVIDTPKGHNGFGYDPVFIPKGYDNTLGELPDDLKKKIGHRAKGLNLALKIITSLLK
jgi:XTP/dITP diphosphohydrolase